MRLLRSLALLTLLATTGCATLSQFRALTGLDFSIDGVSRVHVSGIDLANVRSYGDLGFSDVANLAASYRSGELPLAFDVTIRGDNPAANGDARMLQMEWALSLEGRETVRGLLAEEYLFPAGQATTFPVAVELDLLEFFEGNAQDLFELALSLSGNGGSPKTVELEVLPVISTALGPLAYPEAIRMQYRVGG